MSSLTKTRDSMTAATGPAPAVPGVVSLSEQIRARAFQIYQARKIGGIRGDAVSDWLQAELELSGKTGRPTASPVVKSGLSPRAIADQQLEAREAARGEVLLRSGI